ncbi:FHA domain-containing protein [Curtobacterium sp. PhB115]|nr:FHA domain-containing protein [Curtobacterium sp. PhB115]ROP60684.1 FHA domain-containing protein [Curtobacterium sp. PhB115]
MLPDGAIFCGECGRAVTAAASRRPVTQAPVEQAPPPPLQQPDAHGRRSDPATDAWLPESTLDPATRAWLTGADRQETAQPPAVPVQRPDDFAPRDAPSHVHGAGSGLSDWSGSSEPVEEPPLDPNAYPSEPAEPTADDPERTRLSPLDEARAQQQQQQAAPVWAPPVAPVPPAAPAGPSWWVGRGGTAEPEAAAPVVPPVPSAPRPETAAASDGTADAVDAGVVDAPTGDAAGDPAAADARDQSSVVDAPTPAGEPAAAPEADVVQHDAPPVVSPPQPGDTAVVEPLVDRRPVRPAPLVTPGMHATTICHVCGNRLEPDDIFCGECGAVRPAVTAAFTGPVVPLPMARPDWAAEETDGADESGVSGESGVSDDDGASDVLGESDELDVPGPRADEVPSSSATAPTADLADSQPWLRRPRGAHAAPEPAPEPTSERSAVPPMTPIAPIPGSATAPSSAPSATPTDGFPLRAPLPPVPGATGPVTPPPSDQRPESSAVDDDLDADVDETRIVAKTPTRAPFVLHFSTGERFGVHGTGLLGRLPRPQPGERYDDLLTVHDPGKSVSKTHLELGRDGDDLWVSDRFSGNGTVVRHIDGSIRRCEPGRRYRVERGARVDIGEQFFLVQ